MKAKTKIEITFDAKHGKLRMLEIAEHLTRLAAELMRAASPCRSRLCG